MLSIEFHTCDLTDSSRFFYYFILSYSRQNLLSTNSCKSNEDVGGSMTNSAPHNRDAQYNQQTHYSSAGSSFVSRNPLPTQMTHNNLPTIGNNKYTMQFRNQINQQHQQQQQQQHHQQNAPIVTPDVLNVNQFHQQHDIIGHASAHTNFNNSNLSTSMPVAGAEAFLICTGSPIVDRSTVAVSDGNLIGNYQQSSNNINSYNFDLNELKEPKTTIKMLPKSSTGNKRLRHSREREQNNLNGASGGGVPCINGDGDCSGGAWGMPLHDLNLSSTKMVMQGSKAPAKLFDDLKENVYQEVSALISANESRPEFLINLFRDLQFISTSDPLRNRLLQAFSEVCSQDGEPELNVIENEGIMNHVSGFEGILIDGIGTDLILSFMTICLQNVENLLSDSPSSSNNRENLAVSSVDVTPADDNPMVSCSLQTQSLGVVIIWYLFILTQFLPDLHASSDESSLRAIMHDVGEFLMHEVSDITDNALQRVLNIIMRHLGNMGMVNGTESLHSDVLKHILDLDRHSHKRFLETLEKYLSSLLSIALRPRPSVNQMQPNLDLHSSLHDRQPQHDCSILDLTPKPRKIASLLIESPKTNDVHAEAYASPIADVVAVIVPQQRPKSQQSSAVSTPPTDPGHMMGMSNNQDLAEADQICSNDDEHQAGVGSIDMPSDIYMIDYMEADSFSNPNVIGDSLGAVGGVGASQLPDLANVSSRITMFDDDEAVHYANGEDDRGNGQSATDINLVPRKNCGAAMDPKQKKQIWSPHYTDMNLHPLFSR